MTAEEVDFFMKNGYVVIKGAFTKQAADEWTKEMWVRLGFDPNDKSTWIKEKPHMPWHNRVAVSEFAPRVSFL